MARRTKTIKVPMGHRDEGRTFHLKEMGAMKTEKFATKIILILIGSGFEIPGWNINDGVEGLIEIGKKNKDDLLKGIVNGLLGSLQFPKLEPLLDEMISCVTWEGEKDGKPTGVMQKLSIENMDDYVEDVKTILLLRKEIISLHVGFDLTGTLSTFLESQEKKETGKPTEVMPTSQDS